jgi:hypothetical protein
MRGPNKYSLVKNYAINNNVPVPTGHMQLNPSAAIIPANGLGITHQTEFASASSNKQTLGQKVRATPFTPTVILRHSALKKK